MKKVTALLAAALLLASTLPGLAQQSKQEKDECLLASKNCADEVDTIQKHMKKLRAEIKKGKKVYSAEELKKLQDKLKEADEMIKNLTEGSQ